MGIEIIIDYLFIFLREIWSLCVEMAPFLLLGMFVSGLISVFIHSSIIYNHIGSKNLISILKSTLFGIPLPLCSCGVIPVAATLRESGASKGSTVSFLVSTPQTGVDSIFLTYGMLGPIFALFRPMAALFSGVFSGLVINKIDDDEHHHLSDEDSEKKHNEPLRQRIISGFRYGFISLPADIVVPLFQGLIVAAAISIFIPPDFIASRFVSNAYVQFLMMLAISIPLYVCATASIPIAVALMAKGVSPGAAFVFLMAGPATNASSIAVIKNILGKKTLYYYLILIAFTAVIFGLLLDIFLSTAPSINPNLLHHHDHGGIIRISMTILFLLILVNAYLQNFVSGDSKSSEQDTKLDGSVGQIEIFVDGMTCGHCKESVENAVNSFSGVEHSSVDLISGKVVISGGDINEIAIKKKIIARGFTIK
ncbi:MAG: permease [Candidatus Neomarinimicrobiota bacterium]